MAATKRTRKKRDQLVLDHIDLVESIARRVHARVPPSFDFDDLFSEGLLALCRAVAKYDPAANNGTPFSAFARKSIRGAIIDSCRRKNWREHTRQSIDDRGPDCRSERRLRLHLSPAGPEYLTEVEAALGKMAAAPQFDADIDRSRAWLKVIREVEYLSPAERQLIIVWYGPDEPNLRNVARRLGIRQTAARELHDAAIAKLQAQLTPRRVVAFPTRPTQRQQLPKAA